MLSPVLYSWQISVFSCFIRYMLVSSVQYSPYSSIKFNQKPAFTGGKPIDLYYILEKRSNLLPERILKKVRRIVDKGTKPLPTLKEVHLKTYAPLLECKTLDEAKSLFPEFSGMKEAHISFKRYSNNIKKLVAGGYLEDNFSLKILQEFWGKLKSQDEVAKEMGLDGRTSLAWVLQKIGFVNYNTNYKTLLMASSPDSRAKIAAKTMAWNAAHPDLMRARNKHAAQFCKTPEYRKAHSQRMKEYDKLHPERIKKIREFDKAVWEKIPEVRAAMTQFAQEQSTFTRLVIRKEIQGNLLDAREARAKKGFYKKFWQAHPEMLKRYKEAHKLVREERLLKK